MRVLIKHFFERFVDKESLSPQGEAEANVSQILGFLAVPGAFVVLLFQFFSFRGWDLVTVRCFFVSFSMIVIGFIVVFEWDALFPDRRDYQILTPLPIGQLTLFLAKATALGLFLGVFLVDVNFFSALMWPGIDGEHGPVGGYGNPPFRAVMLSGLFAALAEVAAVQGVLITMSFQRHGVPAWFPTWMQTLLMGALVMLLFRLSRLDWHPCSPAW